MSADPPQTGQDIVDLLEVNLETECWEWPRYRGNYGHGDLRRRILGERLIHRIVWTHYYGKIDEGLTLDHLCCNPPCANPEHLEPCSFSENTIRMLERKTGRTRQEFDQDLVCFCGKEKSRRATECIACRNPMTGTNEKIVWPHLSEVVSLVKSTSFRKAGAVLGVSDNSVRKFLRRNNVDPKGL